MRSPAKTRIPAPSNRSELGSGVETAPLSAANPVAIAPLAALAGEEVTKMCAAASNPSLFAVNTFDALAHVPLVSVTSNEMVSDECVNPSNELSAGKYGDRHIRPSPFPAILRIWRCCWNQPSRLLLRLIKVPAAPVRSAGSGCNSWLLVQVPQSVLNRDQYVCKQVQFIHALGVA